MKHSPRSGALHSLARVMTTIAFASGCNAISGLDDDYKVNETSGTERPEAGAGADTGSTPGTDATVRAAACPQPNVFCEDFENVSSSAPPFGWSRHERAGGEPRIGTEGFQSSHALNAAAGAAGCPGVWPSCAVALWHAVAGGLPDGSTLRVKFRFRVKAADNAYAVIAAVQLNDREYGLAVYRHAECPSNGTCLDENDLNGAHEFDRAVAYPRNEWQDGQIEVTRHGVGFAGKVFVNGALVDERPDDALPAGAPTDVDVGVGAFFTGRSGLVETDIDDVYVTRSP